MAGDLDPAQLQALCAAVSEGTFEAAARALHISASAVSQRIKALENAAGRVLLTRTKPVQVTASGEVVLRFARQLDALASDLTQELGGAARTVIPLAVNADSLATWVLPALARLRPSICFDIHRGDQDHTHELLRAGTVMAAVASSADAVPGCETTRLGTMRYRPMAAPAFAARWFPSGAPTARELAMAPMLQYDRVDLMQDRYLRRRSRARLDPPRHYIPSSTEMLRAIVLGFGWGMLPDLQSDGPRAAGELVGLDARGSIEVALSWVRWRLHSAALDEVSATVRAYAVKNLR